MSYQYYDDPIEDYEAEGQYGYNNQQGHASATVNQNADNYYYDDDLDLDYELSSPSPVRTLKPSYDHQPTGYEPYEDDSGYYENDDAGVPYQNLGRDTTNRNQTMSSHPYGGLQNSQRYARQQSQSWRPTANSVGPENQTYNNNRTSEREHPASTPRNTHGVRLRPVSELSDKFRSIFKFGVFNAVQSTCMEEVLHGSKNLVISAPTGSGKTVLFELAMIRALEQSQNRNKPIKCIYIAPTKALCTEKFQDWVAKFEPLGFKCCELTGDTVVSGGSAWGEAKHASIIVTTCEKWDSLTRNWHEHERILSEIGLFLVDEVHILNESRGSVLEVVTSRMKLRGPGVRFVLVSATVPNINDVAQWIGSGFGKSEPAVVFEFGDEYRPCKLTRHVVGFPKKNGQNDFQFNKVLDFKLFQVIKEYSAGKPILIFVSTRKGVFGTAEQLMKDYIQNEEKKAALPWSRPSRFLDIHCCGLTCKRSILADLTVLSMKSELKLSAVGIGVHHAGLSMDDRRTTERLFLNKSLRVLVATSTLAVGVNLPAHMVIIKGVQTFVNNASREYSDLDVMQMLGRAGRPQFDKDGIAIILCEAHLEAKYKALVQGKTVLESSLHLNLAEHINSEIGLGTITDVSSAKDWLQSSFLYQRMQRNPQYYTITKADGELAVKDDSGLVQHSIEQLKETQLIEHEDKGRNSGKLSSTPYGDIMSKYYIRRSTMELILALPEHATLKDILGAICAAEEFQDCKLRASEKTLYNKLRKDIDMRFEVKKVEKTTDKIFLLVQAVLGGISFNNPEYKSSDSQPNMEAFAVFKHISRVAKAALDVAVVKKDGAQVKHGLELCLSAKAWDDRAIVLRQIEHLGEKSIKVLAEHGITTFAQLRKANPLRIETLLNRRSPFGLQVISSANDLPQYGLQIKELEISTDGGKSAVEVTLEIECSLVNANSSTTKNRKSRTRSHDRTMVLTLTSEMDFVDFRRIPSKALRESKSFTVTVQLAKPSQSVTIVISSENVAGVSLQQSYKPSLPPSEYPVPQTRPLTSVEMDLVGLEDDPDFWNMTLTDSPEPTPRETVKNVKTEAPIATQEQSEPSAPVMRPDGKYNCNHPCKDKTACRHLCCREGLAEPPHSKKKVPSIIQKDAGPPTAPKDIRKKQPAKPQALQSSTNVKSLTSSTKNAEKNMKQLDDIHTRANAVNNFQLPKGQQRLKLEVSSTKSRSRLPLDFDMEFTNISDSGPVSSAFPDAVDDEEMPESIFPPGSQPKSIPSSQLKARLTRKKPDDENASLALPESGPSRKRIKTAHARSPSCSPKTLFLPSGSSDSDSIEVSSPVPVAQEPQTPAWTSASISEGQDIYADTDFNWENTWRPTPTPPRAAQKAVASLPHKQPSPEPQDDVAQALADLDDFFNSSAVQII